MPLYEFSGPQGVVELFYHMADAPPIGAVVRRDGVRLRRIASAPGATVRDYEHVSHSLAQWVPKSPGEKCPYPHVVEVRPGRYKPAFKSKREIEEFSARTGGRMKYD